MPDQTCPVPTNKLEDYRRKIAHKDTGTTEDFEEAPHNLDHSQQKKMLDTAWKGETWFKVKANAKPPRPVITTPATTTKHQPEASQQTPQAVTQQPARRHTGKQPERQQGQAPSSVQQPTQPQQYPHRKTHRQHQTTGYVKDICGKESTSIQEQTSTYHNRPRMDQMSPSSSQSEQQW